MSEGIDDEHGAQRDLQIEAAVGEVEAFVTNRKIRDGRAAQGEGETGPVVKRRVDDLVAAESAGVSSQGDVADFTAPSFDEGHSESVGGGCSGFASKFAFNGSSKLFAKE